MLIVFNYCTNMIHHRVTARVIRFPKVYLATPCCVLLITSKYLWQKTFITFQLDKKQQQSNSSSEETSDMKRELREMKKNHNKAVKDKTRLEAEIHENIKELQELEKRLTGKTTFTSMTIKLQMTWLILCHLQNIYMSSFIYKISL